MAIPQRIPISDDPDQVSAVAVRWGITCSLARKLIIGASRLPFDVHIFSGARTRAHQEALGREGRPAAPYDLSTHAATDERGCPREATGADVQPVLMGIRVNRPSILQLGASMQLAGLRWGGGSPFNDHGIPADTWHFDEGPR